MKIAFTADTHLRTAKESLHKYNALRDILQQMSNTGIEKLVVAGDLFDKQFSNYVEFEEFCSSYKERGIEFHILPGNHDAGIKTGVFAADNIKVYDKTKLVGFEDTGLPILFVPYLEGKTIGEEIASYKNKLEPAGWILAAHGDWLGSSIEPNPSEPGTYMPLTKKDILIYKPARVVLGHIHKPLDINNLHYCGSPVGLEINETGKRRYLALDLRNNNLESHTVNTDALYFTPILHIYPMENEKTYLEEQVSGIIDGWGLTKEEIKKTKIRIKISGYTSDKKKLNAVIENSFKDFKNIDAKIDLSEVYLADNYELNEISKKVINHIENLDLGKNLPAKDEIILSALKTIYAV
jgi:DNA repair exonuclease SbcCD nuclease subunit